MFPVQTPSQPFIMKICHLEAALVLNVVGSRSVSLFFNIILLISSLPGLGLCFSGVSTITATTDDTSEGLAAGILR